MKSIMGYGVAAAFAYAVWFAIHKYFGRWYDETKPVSESNKTYWRIAQWVATGGLWYTWLSHDIANIAVFLPRVGKIQKIVLEKHNTRYVRSATLIDLFYWLCLYFFKELNDIPMSTTWVFVGLLAGRELAMATYFGKKKTKSVFPLVAKDFGKMMVGLGASVALVLMIHYIIVPSGL